jgi:hypothetical protein
VASCKLMADPRCLFKFANGSIASRHRQSHPRLQIGRRISDPESFDLMARSDEPARWCFPAAPLAAGEENVATVDGVEAGVSRRAGLGGKILIDKNRFTASLIDAVTGGLAVLGESFSDRTDEPIGGPKTAGSRSMARLHERM